MSKIAIFVIGPPASGKSSIAERLSHHYSLKWVSMGKLLRKIAYNKKDHRSSDVRRAIESGKGASDNLILSIYKDHIRTNKKGVIFDGNPGGKYQAQRTIQLLKENKINDIFCIRLTCPRKLCVERIAKRNSNIRKDGSLKIIEKRFNWYKTKVLRGYKSVKKNSQLTIVSHSGGYVTATMKRIIKSFNDFASMFPHEDLINTSSLAKHRT